MLFGSLTYKTKQFFLVLIKLSIVIGAFYFIYLKLTNNEALDFTAFAHFLQENERFTLKTVFFLVFLSIFNWFLEILKWRTIVGSVKKIGFKSAIEQSLGALTASILTPNRIGEYGAKAIYFEPSLRKKIVLLNLLSNVMQMSTTCIFGIIGFACLQFTYELPVHYLRTISWFSVFFVLGFLVVHGLKKTKVKGYSIDQVFAFVKTLSVNILGTGMLLSILRYLVFSFQFYMLLRIFGIQINYLNAMAVISSMYLLSSLIPVIFIFDVVIKGSVAVYLFSIIGVNEFITLCVVTIMWLLNFVLPSVFGSYYVLNFNLPKSTT